MTSPKSHPTLWWTQNKKVLCAGTLLWRAGALPTVGKETGDCFPVIPLMPEGTQEDATCPAPSGDSENRAEAALRSEQVSLHIHSDVLYCLTLLWPHLHGGCSLGLFVTRNFVRQQSRSSAEQFTFLCRPWHPPEGDSCSFGIQIRFVLMLSLMPRFSSFQLSMALLRSTISSFWTTPGYPDWILLLGWLVPV